MNEMIGRVIEKNIMYRIEDFAEYGDFIKFLGRHGIVEIDNDRISKRLEDRIHSNYPKYFKVVGYQLQEYTAMIAENQEQRLIPHQLGLMPLEPLAGQFFALGTDELNKFIAVVKKRRPLFVGDKELLNEMMKKPKYTNFIINITQGRRLFIEETQEIHIPSLLGYSAGAVVQGDYQSQPLQMIIELKDGLSFHCELPKDTEYFIYKTRANSEKIADIRLANVDEFGLYEGIKLVKKGTKGELLDYLVANGAESGAFRIKKLG